jgi:Ring hydroxylating beta subunit
MTLLPDYYCLLLRIELNGADAAVLVLFGKRAGMSPTDVAVDRRAGARAGKPLDVQACEQFLLHEARLLGEGRFGEWLALFTPDASYWVPSEPDQKSPFDTVSLIYDDRFGWTAGIGGEWF